MELIEKYIEQYLGIGGSDLSPVAEMFKPSTLDRGQFLIKKGQYARTLGFVESGFLRMFALDQHGAKEVTQWIASDGMFVADLSSFTFGTPSRWNIQALSDCKMSTITKEDYDSIGDYVDNWSKLDKLFIAKCFITLEDRVFNQLSMSSEQKVKKLMKDNPSIFNQVQLQYIASMLGMTPETLSRIRKKMTS